MGLEDTIQGQVRICVIVLMCVCVQRRRYRKKEPNSEPYWTERQEENFKSKEN